MSEPFNLSEYKIIIGGRELIESHITNIVGGDVQDAKNQEKVNKALMICLKEIRVRIGTLLKTDNVSFLIGAGASLSTGGVSLVNIPIPLEEALVKKVENENGTDFPEWLKLFYSSLNHLTKKEFTTEDRIKLFKKKKANIEPIPLNLESYLNTLFTWNAGMGGTSTSLQLNGDVDLQIKQSDLKTLIKKITSTLVNLLNLPKITSEESTQKDSKQEDSKKKDSEDPLKIHRKFIKRILTRPLNLRRANLFTLNYDTLIEQAADAEGSILVDGFVGTLRRVFRPESYNIDYYFPAQTTEGRVHRFDRALHLYKLHGSITWHRTEKPNWENPFGFYATFYNQEADTDNVLIYPTPLKYGQTLGMPYSELFRRFGNAIAQPQSTLFVIGYGFGDEHVNALITQALAIPSFTLIIVDPKPESEYVKQLESLEDERVWIVQGWALGTFKQFVEKLLPDLKEEEIDTKVMRTFSSLMDPSRQSSENTGEGVKEREKSEGIEEGGGANDE